MIDDPHAILLGLYRESEATETLVSRSSFTEKAIKILKKEYILKEHKIEGRSIWHLYEKDSEIPISREDVLHIYAMANFNRQSSI
jgi:hypothetical protein